MRTPRSFIFAIALAALPACQGSTTSGMGTCTTDSDCTVAHGTGACNSGSCAVASCASEYADCDHAAANGCEVALATDPGNCGACGAACGSPSTCSGGICAGPKLDAGATDAAKPADLAISPDLSPGAPGDAAAAIDLTMATVDAATTADLIEGADAAAAADLTTPSADAADLALAVAVDLAPAVAADLTLPAADAADAADLAPDAADAATADAADLAPADAADLAPAPDLSSDFSVVPTCPGGCSLANAASACMLGTCVIVSCSPGYADCNHQPADGCEVSTTADPTNCNACGNLCPSGPNSTALCTSSQCALVCAPSYADCDVDPTDGCEVYTDGDPSNCGVCGMACPSGTDTPACASGQCTIARCSAGYTDCDGLATDGCEVSTADDTNNCGTCGHVCAGANEVPECASGQCTIGICDFGYADCDGDPSNGCETNDGFDPSNCGFCGNACNLPNAGSECTFQQCTIATCQTGYQDCDRQPANGCEASIASDPDNCGGCGHTCTVANGVAGCSGENCDVAKCDAGYGDCDGAVSNGCEIDLDTDVANCGACGHACAAPSGGGTAGCVSGACTGSCGSGTTLCGAGANGGGSCTTPASGNDPKNCGACGVACATGLCGSGIYADFTSAPTNWNFNGEAHYDITNQSGVLTTAGFSDESSTIVYKDPLPIDSTVDVVFDFRISNSTGGDGMGVMIEKTGAMATGAPGGGLGMAGLTGYGAELDVYNDNNCSDSSANHAGVDNLLACDATLNTPTSLATTGNLSAYGITLTDGAWHTATMQIASGTMSLVVDNKSLLTSVTLPGFVVGDSYYFGFAAGSGGLTETAEIRNVEVLFSSVRCL